MADPRLRSSVVLPRGPQLDLCRVCTSISSSKKVKNLSYFENLVQLKNALKISDIKMNCQMWISKILFQSLLDFLLYNVFKNQK